MSRTGIDKTGDTDVRRMEQTFLPKRERMRGLGRAAGRFPGKAVSPLWDGGSILSPSF
jgi:hypothetical protein